MDTLHKLFIDRIESPIGNIIIVTDEQNMCALDYEAYQHRMHRLLGERYSQYNLVEAHDPLGYSTRIRKYFEGDLDAIETISVEAGGSEFQRDVWAMLRKIPVGTTVTYGQIAAKLGKPEASRAVGLANSLNPIAIVVPCHRVIGADDKLTGYAGGLERKRWLLQHEGVYLTLNLDYATVFESTIVTP
jgi:methylated-DNA-[protein]-cysteine S-methyltransferase